MKTFEDGKDDPYIYTSNVVPRGPGRRRKLGADTKGKDQLQVNQQQ